MRNLFLGVLFIVLVGIGGFAYRYAAEHPNKPGICPVGERICPNGEVVNRVGERCEFAECGVPNVSFPNYALAFAIPEGFAATTTLDANVIAVYEKPTDSWLSSAVVLIRRFPITASSTGLDVIKQTAIGGASGEPVNPTRFTSTTVNNRTYTVVSIERFEAVITTAYYLVRSNDVLRFDAIDRDVLNWTDPVLDISTLPAHRALRELLSTLQIQ
jgi:hypothetical protein